MKSFLILLLVIAKSSLIFAQKLPDVNVVIGMTSVIDTKSSTARSRVGGYSFAVEKPLKIFVRKNNLLSVHPGILYAEINEDFSTSGLGRYYDYEIIASSTSIYSKILINSKIKSNVTLYTGASIGAYFWSHISNKNNSSKKYYDNGKSFFSSGFWGLLFGIRTNLSESVKFMPAVEISYYPNYVDSNIGTKNAINVSLLFGFGTKKATRSE
jgi:hypothetical protein